MRLSSSFATGLFAPCLLSGLALGTPQTSAGSAQAATGVLVDELDFPGPDFSFAGRDSRAAEPPVVSPASHVYFDVRDHGAVPNDGQSDRLAIQAAIVAAEAFPGPAVVWFPAGRFVLRGENEVSAPEIRVRRSDLVLKGAGMYSGGTELFLASESVDAYAIQFWPDLDPSVGWRGAFTLTDLAEIPDRGVRDVLVEDPSGLTPGAVVRLAAVLPDTFPEFRAFFGPLGDDALIQEYFERSSGSGADWRSDFLSTLEIEAVEGNTVRFKEPLVADYAAASPTYKGGHRLVQIFAPGDAMLTNVGIEDLAFVSNYRDNFKHFFNRAADGYDFVEMRDVRESWIRRVRMRSGTRAITFSANGKSNVVYDVLFEGNSGHYSITHEGNNYGHQASFLREEAPVHHGFGATSSAFATVYHRCNQFGGPEGHGGYPQATLYDRNEGDLSVSRIGGAPPHQSKDTVFWNWHQSQFIPVGRGVRGVLGRYRATTLNGVRVDFWPDMIMRPYVIGLSGVPLTVLDAATDIQELQRLDGPVAPDSLFEAQLAARLGAVPRWLRERAESFESVTRTTRVDIGSPGNDARLTRGEVLDVAVRLDPQFDRAHLARVELRVARGHDLDFPETVVARSNRRDVESLRWKPAVGPWRLRLLLVNSLGEESFSEPTWIFVEPDDTGGEPLDFADGWLQPRNLDGRTIMESSSDVPFVDYGQYHDAVRAIEKPLVQTQVDSPANRNVAAGLIDGDLSSNATAAAGLRFFGNKGLVFDLGEVGRVDYLELVGPGGSANRDYFGMFDVQVSTDDEAEYSYTNSDFSWRTVRRMGHARASARMPFSGDRMHRIHFPAGTEARYVRLIIRLMDSAGNNNGNLAEVRAGRYPGLDPGLGTSSR